MEEVEKIIIEIFPIIWNRLIKMYNPKAKTRPIGFVLGGQPGSGKSNLIKKAMNDCNNDIVVINADDFRKYHPNYTKIQKSQGKNSSNITSSFSGKMAEKVLKECLKNHFNLVIEGTFRTAETPINTLKLLKNYGYFTNVLIQTCNKELSWKSCLERY